MPRVVAWFLPTPRGGESAGGKRLRFVTRHFSHPGVGEGAMRYTDNFMWKKPQTEQDGFEGGFCSRSGVWFPGHMLVSVKGRTYGQPFAPKPYSTEALTTELDQ